MVFTECMGKMQLKSVGLGLKIKYWQEKLLYF